MLEIHAHIAVPLFHSSVALALPEFSFPSAGLGEFGLELTSSVAQKDFDPMIVATFVIGARATFRGQSLEELDAQACGTKSLHGIQLSVLFDMSFLSGCSK